MAHVIEPAASARARCRGCDQRIARGELRLGERLPNAYGEGEMTLWFHLVCAAFKRPEPLLEALAATTQSVERRDFLETEAAKSLAYRRLPRLSGAQRAPSGRARCRGCRELVTRGVWRIALVFYEEGRFQPSGFIHARCCAGYMGTADVLDRVRHFSPELEQDDLDDLREQLLAP